MLALPESSDTSQFLSLAPMSATSLGETHSALLLSQASWSGDLTFGGSILTEEQLRLNSAPHPWETAWVVWNYADNDHFYYFAFKTNGWELGKRDPAYTGGQRFLATGTDTSFLLKTWYGFSVVQTGATMSVSVDGVQIVSFTDQERPYLAGRLGVYTEDARIFLDNVTGPATDDFESYAQTALHDGSLLGAAWITPFLGYGTGAVTSLDLAPVSPAVVLSLPVSAAPTTNILGTQKADKLAGTSGPDLLDGKAGGDTMSGGAGDDTYVVDNSKDRIVESPGAGVDTVRSSLGSYTLPANLENLQLIGGKGQKGVGNGLDNILTSNGVGATLSGGAGDDILISNGGRDTLIGGLGHDVFRIAALPASPALIADFTRGEDVLDLRAPLAGYAGPDPVVDGWVKLASDGSGGTMVYVDPDGPATGAGFLAVADLQGVAGPLSMQVDWVFC